MKDRSEVQRAAWAKWQGDKAARLAPMQAAITPEQRVSIGKRLWASRQASLALLGPDAAKELLRENQAKAQATVRAWSPERRRMIRERMSRTNRAQWATRSVSQRRKHGMACTRSKYRGHDRALWAQLDEAAQIVIDLTHPRYQEGQAEVWASLRAIQRGERTPDFYNPHAWGTPEYIRSRDALYKAHQRFRDKIGALLYAEPNRTALESALLVHGRIA